MAPAVVDHGEVEQQAQAVDQLPQARQQVGEADADAVFAGFAADAVEGRVALVEQYVDVADLVRIGYPPPLRARSSSGNSAAFCARKGDS